MWYVLRCAVLTTVTGVTKCQEVVNEETQTQTALVSHLNAYFSNVQPLYVQVGLPTGYQ